METYKKERGFVFENPYDYMTGDMLSQYADVEKFVLDVISGNDNHRDERRCVNKQINQYTDGNSSERIADIVFGRQDK
jgi:CDP-glycerol glycerophosphotransferase (TagB/SpsB family)